MPYNNAMSHVELILPFGIPSTAHAADLLDQLAAPSFVTLLSRHRSLRGYCFDPFARALPHEILLAGFFHRDAVPVTQSFLASFNSTCPPVAHQTMAAQRLKQTEGHWFRLSPVHIHAACDHLLLTDRRALELHAEEADTLFASANEICREYGHDLLRSTPSDWFLRADEWHGLDTASPDAASGHNVDIWMPRGEKARAWRKLQNEIQMVWHDHPLNHSREERGAKPVNSVWLWGGSEDRYDALSVVSIGFEQAMDDENRRPVLLDQLLPPALNNDWYTWLEHFKELERIWFAPVLSAMRSGKIKTLRLWLNDGRQLLEVDISSWSIRQFWRKQELHRLFQKF